MSHQGCASLAHGSVEHQLWTWHRRLGHPSLSYLERFFPSLVGSKIQFNGEACILAKSHRHSYSTSINRAKTPFVLIHSDVGDLHLFIIIMIFHIMLPLLMITQE